MCLWCYCFLQERQLFPWKCVPHAFRDWDAAGECASHMQKVSVVMSYMLLRAHSTCLISSSQTSIISMLLEKVLEFMLERFVVSGVDLSTFFFQQCLVIIVYSSAQHCRWGAQCSAHHHQPPQMAWPNRGQQGSHLRNNSWPASPQ